MLVAFVFIKFTFNIMIYISYFYSSNLPQTCMVIFVEKEVNPIFPLMMAMVMKMVAK